MNYEIIEPPFTLKFREMSKQEIKNYYEWFMDVLTKRLEILFNAVRTTVGFENWQADFTPDSLNRLGKWFMIHVETRKKTYEEMEAEMNLTPHRFNVSEDHLTNKTFSLAIDIGMYLSQVFLRNNEKKLEWSQILKNKRHVDYGQPVIIGFVKNLPVNPVGLTITLAYGLANKTKDGSRLRDLYDIWMKYID